MAKCVSTNNVNNISSENYDERESRTDKNSWIQVVSCFKKKEKTSRRQNYPQKSKQIAILKCFASLRYLQESAVGHHGNNSYHIFIFIP
jgi:hypothetical protein